MRGIAIAVLASTLIWPSGAGAGLTEAEPGEWPSIWPIHPPEVEVTLEAGEYVVFSAGASDADCDLAWFDWGSGYYIDPVYGCSAVSSLGITAPDVPGLYYVPVEIYDEVGHNQLLEWELTIVTPVRASSWGRVKALFR